MKVALKPSIAVQLEYLAPDRYRAIFLYDGGRKELVIDLDEESKDLLSHLRETGIDHDDPRIGVFRERNMLSSLQVVDAIKNDKSLLSRQSLFILDISRTPGEYENALQRIKEARIGIVGLGGIGSNVYALLLRMGFEKFVLIDPDKVEASNLNRQSVYNFEDIGRLKIDVAQNSAIRLTGTSQIEAHAKTTEDLGGEMIGCDIIVNCADVPDIFTTSEHVWSRHPTLKAFFVGGGYYCQSSFAGPLLLSGERGKLRGLKQRGPGRHMSAVGGNTSATACLPAAIVAQDVLTYATQIETCRLHGRMWVFDWTSLEARLIECA